MKDEDSKTKSAIWNRGVEKQHGYMSTAIIASRVLVCFCKVVSVFKHPALEYCLSQFVMGSRILVSLGKCIPLVFVEDTSLQLTSPEPTGPPMIPKSLFEANWTSGN